MVSLQDIKRLYIKLYKYLREYLWTYDTVECLAQLEDALLVRFPDLKKCRNLANRLYNMCSEVFNEDEDFKKQFIEFKELLEQNSDMFAYLKSNTKIQEEIENENN